MAHGTQALETAASALVDTTAQVGARLSETAQALDEIARSTCLLALDVAMGADKPAALGKTLIQASHDVRQLAERTATSLADLEVVLAAMESGENPAMMAQKNSIDRALTAFIGRRPL
jgi:methyl-accepting chemotaxis protein